MKEIILGDPQRCDWCGDDPVYVAYHDTEWGVPERDSRALWEKLILDGFQAGLSWITILRKRENFRTAFDGFEPARIATWGEAEVERLLGDAGIVRHRGKIEATIGNARAYLAIEERLPFAEFCWSFVKGTPVQTDLMARTRAWLSGLRATLRQKCPSILRISKQKSARYRIEV